jgi:predicted TIM-barrel fold metal-dependent hydrolase
LVIHALFVTQANRLIQLADLDLAQDVNDGPETSKAIASLGAKLQQLRILLNHIGNIRITAKLSPPDWVELIRATTCQTNIFVKISALVESAPRDGKKAPEYLAFYKTISICQR